MKEELSGPESRVTREENMKIWKEKSRAGENLGKLQRTNSEI